MPTQDILQVQGIMQKGYGIIPKLPMLDKRLTPEAKGIYAYFRSYAGAGTTAFPGRDKIIDDMQMGKNRYYKHLALLVEHGYLCIEQNVDAKGRFKNNIYTLLEVIDPPSPDKNNPRPQNKDTEPCPQFPYTENPYMENGDTNNNNSKNSSTNIINHSQSHSLCQSRMKQAFDSDSDMDNNGKGDIKAVASVDDYAKYKALIHSNIDYLYIVDQEASDAELIDALVEIMLDVILTEIPNTVKVGKEIKSRELVKSAYLKLNSEHILHVVGQYTAQRHKITRNAQYLRTMLYNVTHEMDAHFANLVQADGVV